MSAKLHFLHETKRREKEGVSPNSTGVVSHAVKRDEIPTEGQIVSPSYM